MKFIDTYGRTHSADLRPSKWEVKVDGEGRGKFQSFVGEIVRRLYPLDILCEEFPCYGEGLKLDFFLPRKMIAIEVQGRQHYEFIKHFHGTRDGFVRQKQRDSRKARWCELNNIKLIKIPTGEPEENIKSLILDN